MKNKQLLFDNQKYVNINNIIDLVYNICIIMLYKSLQWSTNFFNLLGKLNFVQKIGGKNLTEANSRAWTTTGSKNGGN